MLVFVACFLVFSCTDQGCIDADDFGEYESETLTVSANSSQNSCTYDASSDITNSEAQGSYLTACFTTGNAEITNESGSTVRSTTGCLGYTNAEDRELCISMCIQKCLSESTANGVNEPGWISTNKRSSSSNYGVTILPGSQIEITATGDVNLGSSVNYEDVVVRADKALPNSYKTTNWSESFLDVRAGQSLNLKFSGKYSDGLNEIGGGTNGLSATGDTANDAKIYNGSRRLVAYFTPHPTGYDFDNTQTSEKLGAKNVPLLPDPVSWQCDYSGTGTTYAALNQVVCSNNVTNGYTANGYTRVDNSAAASVFPISSSVKTNILGEFGGVVKWSSEVLMPDNATNIPAVEYDPLGSVTSCSENNCSLPSNITSDMAILVNSSGNQVDILNPSASTSVQYAVKVSFRNIGSSCTAANSFGATILDSSGNVVVAEREIKTINGRWSAEHITLENNQKLRLNFSYIGSTSQVSATCRKALVAKFRKYHDIAIEKSGLISFTTLGAQATGGNCSIKARIINPKGSQVAVSGLSADFYEYDNFATTSSTDPSADFPLTYSSSSQSLSWSREVFVRKGQKIRFSPESWDNFFQTNSGLKRQCGTGMVMQIRPRPALLCRGRSSASNPELINNPNCIIEYSTATGSNGRLKGCGDYASECYATGNYYCPISACQKPVINCVDATNNPSDINPYAKTSCELQSTVRDAANCPSSSNTTKCNACSNLMLTKASSSARISINDVDKCYDLENYEGKVSNIPTTGFTDSQLSNQDISKKAAKLTTFNGSYGNFEDFTDTKTTDTTNSNRLFELKRPITFSKPGRLKFMVIDSNDFSTSQLLDSYTNNSAGGSSYTGDNGFKISQSGTLSFTNGEWLQVKLCKESGSDTYDCRVTNLATTSLLSNQPKIVEISSPTSASDKPNITNNYKFDPYGNLFKFKSSTETGECTVANSGVDSATNSYFYCHTEYFQSAQTLASSSSAKRTFDDQVSKLRITFKILDPETNNCKISNPEATTGFDGIKVENSYYKSSDYVKNAQGNYVLDANGNPTTQSLTNNIGKICGDKSGGIDDSSTTARTPGPNTGQCQKQFICVNKYFNNTGEYQVNVRVKSSQGSNTSDIIKSVIKPIIEVMDGTEKNCSTTGRDDLNGTKTLNPAYTSSSTTTTSTTEVVCSLSVYQAGTCSQKYYCAESSVGQSERMYKLLIGDPRFQAILKISLVMMFTFYGVGYLMGVSEFSHSEIVNRIIKIGLIYLFTSSDGWYWFDRFFVSIFKSGTDYLAFTMASSFDNSPGIQSAIETGNYYDKSVLFGSVDRVFNMIFSATIQKKISALLFSSIFGWAYLLIIFYGLLSYVYSVANAVLLYLTSQVFISILFTLGPIFFVLTLFNQTKEMFGTWLSQLIGLSLQQIFLLTTLAFFNMLMYEVIKMSLGYKICWDEVWTINIITRISLLSFWTIASLPPRTNTQSSVGDIGNPDGIPSLFTILFIWIIASMMEKFIGFMTNVAASISGSLKASELGGGVMDAAKSVKKAVGSASSWAYQNSGAKNMVQRLDQSLFDSGELAEKARKDKKAARLKDSKDTRELKKAGKEAENKLKKDPEFHKKSASEQQKLLQEAKISGMKKRGDELGLKPEKIDQLINKKGIASAISDYEGSNLLELGANLAYQRVTQGKFNESLADSPVSNKISASIANEMMSKMTKEEREDFKKHANVERSAIGKALKAGGDLRRAAESSIQAGKEFGSKISNKEGREELKESIKDGVRKAPSKLSNVARSMKDSAMSLVQDKEYNEAEEALEKAGEIDTFANGMKWARSSEEKKKIQEFANKLKKHKELEKFEEKDPYAIADLEIEDQRLTEYEEAEDKDFMSRVTDKAMANIRGGIKKSLPFGAEKDKRVTNAKNEIAENKKASMAASLNDKEQLVEDLNESLNDHLDEIENINREESDYLASDEFKEKADEIDKLQSIVDKASNMKEEDKLANPEKYNKAQKLALAAKSKINKIKNGDEKLSEIAQKKKDAISSYHLVNAEKNAAEEGLRKSQELFDKTYPASEKADDSAGSQNKNPDLDAAGTAAENPDSAANIAANTDNVDRDNGEVYEDDFEEEELDENYEDDFEEEDDSEEEIPEELETPAYNENDDENESEAGEETYEDDFEEEEIPEELETPAYNENDDENESEAGEETYEDDFEEEEIPEEPETPAYNENTNSSNQSSGTISFNEGNTNNSSQNTPISSSANSSDNEPTNNGENRSDTENDGQPANIAAENSASETRINSNESTPAPSEDRTSNPEDPVASDDAVNDNLDDTEHKADDDDNYDDDDFLTEEEETMSDITDKDFDDDAALFEEVEAEINQDDEPVASFDQVSQTPEYQQLLDQEEDRKILRDYEDIEEFLRSNTNNDPNSGEDKKN